MNHCRLVSDTIVIFTNIQLETRNSEMSYILDNRNGSIYGADMIFQRTDSCKNDKAFYVLNNIHGIWFTNMNLSNIIIQSSNNNKNNETSALFGIYAANFNRGDIARLNVHNCTVSQNGDVIAIIENNTYNNVRAGRLQLSNSSLKINSITILNNTRVILENKKIFGN